MRGVPDTHQYGACSIKGCASNETVLTGAVQGSGIRYSGSVMQDWIWAFGLRASGSASGFRLRCGSSAVLVRVRTSPSLKPKPEAGSLFSYRSASTLLMTNATFAGRSPRRRMK
jgi:hypothetical protein